MDICRRGIYLTNKTFLLIKKKKLTVRRTRSGRALKTVAIPKKTPVKKTPATRTRSTRRTTIETEPIDVSLITFIFLSK